ncbi:MAG: PadR family transcriptional regulator [Crenarchaeota archaeon]|nr:PadR family transcriptional regulator [Thermoproteota archaeon]
MEGKLKGEYKEKGSTVYKESLRNLVMRILLDGPMHGYEIMKKIKEVTNNRWKPAAGTLYPLLDQLRQEGLIEVAEIAVSNVRGGRRIVYKLTDKGVQEAARIIKEKARAKFDVIIFYIIDGAIALKNHGMQKEYEEICQIIRQGYKRLGDVIDDKC